MSNESTGYSPHNEEERLYRVFVKRATDVAIWARSVMHRVEVPRPSVRKRLAGASFALSVDLYGSMCCLGMFEGTSGMYVLARSIVESYTRGFWLAHVADEQSVNQYAARKLSKSFKPLLTAIRKSQYATLSRLGVDANNAQVLDSLAHGDLGHMLLRNINGTEIGSGGSKLPIIAILLLAASTIVPCVESYVRDILDDVPGSLKLSEEGKALLKRLAHAEREGAENRQKRGQVHLQSFELLGNRGEGS